MKKIRFRTLKLLGLDTAKSFLSVILFSLLAYAIAARYDAFEKFGVFVRKHENIDLDEIFYVILILFIFTLINLIIRGVRLQREIITREDTEKRLHTIIEEKDLLMKEYNHRVKNNFQIINSIIDLKRTMNPRRELDDIFTDIINRIYSMSVIHEKLNNNDNLKEIELQDYISAMAERILKSSSYEKNIISFAIISEDIYLEAKKAMYCGLIFNELITNSIKHAFDENSTGDRGINIYLETRESCLHAKYTDTGKGLQGNIMPGESKSLGFMLMSTLITRQLSGVFEINEANHFSISFSFPL